MFALAPPVPATPACDRCSWWRSWYWQQVSSSVRGCSRAASSCSLSKRDMTLPTCWHFNLCSQGYTIPRKTKRSATYWIGSERFQTSICRLYKGGRAHSRGVVCGHLRATGRHGGGNASRLDRPALRSVSPGYLTAIGVRVLDGRVRGGNSERGNAGRRDTRSVARRYFGNARPVGRILDWQLGDAFTTQARVLGVVED